MLLQEPTLKMANRCVTERILERQTEMRFGPYQYESYLNPGAMKRSQCGFGSSLRAERDYGPLLGVHLLVEAKRVIHAF